MATAEFPNVSMPNPDLARLVDVTRAQTAAILAAPLIIAAGRKFSVQEALDLARDIQFSMYPTPGSGHYIAWKKAFDPKKIIA